MRLFARLRPMRTVTRIGDTNDSVHSSSPTLAASGFANMSIQFHSNVNRVFRTLTPVIICLFTLSLGVPAFASPPTNYTVTFYENDGVSDPVSTYQLGSAAQDLTLFSNLNVPFSDSGQTFTGWNTKADGSGTSFSNGQSYSFSADFDLYAQWLLIPFNHTVTFYENDSASDAVSTFQISTAAQNLTLFANLDTPFSDPGNSLTGWNTNANGSGVSYSNGQIYSFASDIHLYAQWTTIPRMTVTFASNGGAGSDSSMSDPVGTSVSLPSSGGFSNPGYTFVDWNTAANGSGSSYGGGATFILNADQIFYAQWTPNQYVVNFEPDGGSVNPNSSIYVYGSAALLLPTPTNANFIFDGWYNETSGGTLIGSAGAMYSPGQSMTLYAQWTPVPVITVNFEANGGSGTPASLNGTSGAAVTLPGAAGVVRSGYTLTSWNSAANGAGASYAPSQSMTLASSMTLYAQWTPIPEVTLKLDASGGTGSLASLSGLPGAAVTLPGATSLVKPGFTMASWNTVANGSGSSYALGQSLTLVSSMTLYAQWNSVPEIVLHFVSDGGSGSLTTLSGLLGGSVALPGSSSLVKSGYTLRSWNTAANGSGTSYALGQSVTLSTSLTLYARWAGTPTAVLYGAVGLFTKTSTQLTAALKSQIRQLATAIKAKGYKKVSLFGYTAETGLSSLDLSLSSARATSVANYLRERLSALKVKGVTILAAGEGAIARMTAAQYSRVEVFVR